MFILMKSNMDSTMMLKGMIHLMFMCFYFKTIPQAIEESAKL